MTFQTQNGSVYEITQKGAEYLWERTTSTERGGVLRTESGPLTKKPKIEIGEGAMLFCPPIKEGTQVRIIYTSDVTEIWT